MGNPGETGTFVLGLGAQKTGTTWLSDYLRTAPGFDHGFQKEYHVFDVLDLESERLARQPMLDVATKGLAAMPTQNRRVADALHRAAFLGDPSKYFDYFAALLRRGATATGDLTPAYSLLSSERLVSIRQQMLDRGVRPIAVFMMRDPVQRIWSHVRMKMPADTSAQIGDQAVIERFDSPAFAGRTRYDHTLAALDDAFPAEDTFVGYYETLFTDSTMRALSEWIGIGYAQPDFDVRRNATRRDVAQLSEETVQRVAESFRDVYLAAAARTPDLDLRELWPSARYVL